MGELVDITPQTQPNPVLNLYPIDCTQQVQVSKR